MGHPAFLTLRRLETDAPQDFDETVPVFQTARPFWLLVGFTALAFGLAGVVLPLLPTTPFLLLAAFAFARSSPRLSAWLHSHPRFGPLIENWNSHGSIDRPTKRVAVVVMAATFALSVFLEVAPWILITQAVVLSAVAVFILTRPDGPGPLE